MPISLTGSYYQYVTIEKYCVNRPLYQRDHARSLIAESLPDEVLSIHNLIKMTVRALIDAPNGTSAFRYSAEVNL